MKYYIMPKPGYDPEDLYIQGMNIRNTIIARIGDGGVLVEVHPYTPSNVERYRAIPHPSLLQEKAVFEYGGRVITLSEKFFSGFLADGWGPFKQLIYFSVQERERAAKDEVIAYIIDDKRYLKNKSKNRQWLSKMIDYLRGQGYLNMVEGLLEIGDRRPPIGKNSIPVNAGYNPVFEQIIKFIESKGVASKGEIADYMIRDLKWIERDPVTKMNSERVLSASLWYLKAKNYIKEVRKNVYEIGEPLEKNE